MRNLIMIFFLCIHGLSLAGNWEPVGSDKEIKMYFDDEKIQLVVFTDRDGKKKKGIRLRELWQYHTPTLCVFPRMHCQKTPFRSAVRDTVYSCSSNMTYVESFKLFERGFGEGDLVAADSGRPIQFIYDWNLNDQERGERNDRPLGPLSSKLFDRLKHLCL
jgi:hypothetical protein